MVEKGGGPCVVRFTGHVMQAIIETGNVFKGVILALYISYLVMVKKFCSKRFQLQKY
jgi:hypothetical protein